MVNLTPPEMEKIRDRIYWLNLCLAQLISVEVNLRLAKLPNLETALDILTTDIRREKDKLIDILDEDYYE